ncbi:hypothetical protein GC089_13470 [Cellulomonas sp. JZ18]|uniref:hypothetical protein n=1 Tax=Cellulomonas sp. JZ18 TaxID=2654191 RepID=UPI0012D3E73E|nr:hypothetical protein [Cellulomonas sp. JZ18]QGQ20031.1 hypothetical protein GC089_13470 [Cellulomonas sp. JZ18]
MSYDLLLVARRPGQTFEQALHDGPHGGGPLGPERLAQWARIETGLRALLGDVHVHVDADAGHAELAHDATGLQVELFADQGAVAYPYWAHEDPAAFHRLVTAVVALVVRETGLEAYDPQAGAPFDGHVDDRTGVAGSAAIAAGYGGRVHDVPASAVPRCRTGRRTGGSPRPSALPPDADH